jgi:hypothetical protein
MRLCNALLDRQPDSRKRALSWHTPAIVPVWPQVGGEKGPARSRSPTERQQLSSFFSPFFLLIKGVPPLPHICQPQKRRPRMSMEPWTSTDAS